jgi:hypothetical protein
LEAAQVFGGVEKGLAHTHGHALGVGGKPKGTTGDTCNALNDCPFVARIQVEKFFWKVVLIHRLDTSA